MLLPYASASRFLPNRSRPPLLIEVQAILAALLAPGPSIWLDDNSRGDLADDLLPLLSEDLKVVSILRPLSGLGLLEVFFVGGDSRCGNTGGNLEEVWLIIEELEAILPTTARSELFLGGKDGRWGSGGPIRDRLG